MNPVFWALVIIAMLLLWCLLSFLFPCIGSLFKTLWDDVVFNITKNEKEKEK